MRKLSLTLLAAGAALAGTAPHAHAQFFNYTTDFETPTGVSVANAFSTDGQSALGIGDVALTGVYTGNAVTVPMYTFATNSGLTNTSGGGTFNYAYRVKVTIAPSDAAGTPLAGYNAITQFVTGTITGQLTGTTNTLLNTYDNLVSTPSGQAEIFNYVFASAGVPTLSVQLRALASGFNNGGSPVPKAGGANAVLAGTPEPGTVGLFIGMSLSGAMVARRRMRRK